MKYNLLEKHIIEKLLCYNNNLFSILNKQFQFSTVINREESTVGFYTKIEVNKTKTEPVNIKSKSIIFWDVLCLLKNKPFMWFVLYIEDWYISMLEWYTFDESFDSFNIEDYQLIYELWEDRKIHKELM